MQKLDEDLKTLTTDRDFIGDSGSDKIVYIALLFD